MSIPSAGIVATARRLTARLMTDACTVVRVTRTQTDSGGWTETTTALPTQPCRIGPLSGRERIAGGKVAQEADLVMTLPFDAGIRWDDRVEHGGESFEITAIDDRTDRLVRRVYLRRTA